VNWKPLPSAPSSASPRSRGTRSRSVSGNVCAESHRFPRPPRPSHAAPRTAGSCPWSA
jgi:hypothetical protein